MSQEQEDQEQNILQRSARWMRVAVLTVTTIGPMVKTISEWIQHRARSRRGAAVEQGNRLIHTAQETGQNVQAELVRRFEEFSASSRQLAADQARQLQSQARQLRSQAQLLRHALRDEARQREQLQKLARQAQKKGADWSKELLNRGEALTGNLVAQTGKISQEVLERGSAMTQDLAERGQRLLQPARGRSRTFWMAVGFSVGLAAAATTTYILIRRRLVAQDVAQDEQIELPRDGLNSAVAAQSRPAGEIRRLDVEGASVATLPKVEVEAPANAAYVGLKSAKRYYTLEAFREQFPESDQGADDLLYFASEDEAKAQGYTAA